MKLRNLVFILLAVFASAVSALARPQYAKKELKPCSYCHVSLAPGTVDPTTKQPNPITRNDRGKWYETHNLSFDGYKAPVATKHDLPTFRGVWRTPLKDSPRKAAIADLAGDGKPRLITLNEDPDKKGGAILVVRKWNGKGWDDETRLAYTGNTERMFVGNVSKTGRQIIVTADSVLTYDSGKLTRRPFLSKMNLMGGVRMKDGSERFLVLEGASDLKTYRVDPSGTNPISGDGVALAALPPEQIAWYDLHVMPDLVAVLGKEAEGGLVGLWRLPETTYSIFYRITPIQDYDVKFESKESRKLKYDVKGQLYHLGFGFLGGEEMWGSMPMSSLPYDVSVFHGKGDYPPGFLTLERESGTDKTCLVTFYALEFVKE